MTHMIEATGVVKRFRDTTALDGLELVADQGVILAVLGPNGAGKTTFVTRSLVWSAVLLLVFGSIAVARYRRG
jgi:ABC-type multidrug transport system ATPase subunit